MAIWKEPPTTKKDAPTMTPEPVLKRESDFPLPTNDIAPISSGPRRTTAPRESRESIIASDITIEGKIDGAGHVRLAGRFKGDVHIQGDLTVEAGAKLTGSVRASNVTVAGELEGNIQEAKRVDLTQSAVVLGDVKSGTLTVVAGARMRGHADFGWDDSGKAGKSNGFAGKSNVS